MRVFRFVAAPVALVLVAACLDLGAVDAESVTTGGCDGGACAEATTNGGEGGAGDAATGDGAAGCAPGTQPADGGCVAVCDGKVCSLHTTCGAGGACVCITGYTLKGADCVFTGGPLDPGFQNTPAAWMPDGGVTLAPTADGGIEPGTATFPNSCSAAARVGQSFVMPDFASAETLALETNVICPGCTQGAVTMNLGVRRGFIDVGATSAFQIARTCLGDRAYGGTVDLALGRVCGQLIVDHAAFVPAPECPKPGTVANGDFETPSTAGKPGEWKAASGNASVGACPSGYCAKLSTNDACANPRLVGGPISVPQNLAKPALRFAMNAPTNVAVDVAMLGPSSPSANSGPVSHFVGRVVGTNSPAQMTLCLPDWSRGMTWPLELSVPATELDSGSCSARVAEATVDALEIVSEPSCDDPGFVFDGSFERGNLVYGYVPLAAGGNASFYLQNYSAHTGTFFAHLSASGVPPSSRTLVVPITVPEGGHPALSYFYRAALSGNVSATLTITGGSPVAQPDVATWTRATQCLPVVATGSGIDLTFKVSSSEYAGQVSLDLDDLVVANDATACP